MTLQNDIIQLDRTMADFASKYEALSTKYNQALDDLSIREVENKKLKVVNKVQLKNIKRLQDQVEEILSGDLKIKDSLKPDGGSDSSALLSQSSMTQWHKILSQFQSDAQSEQMELIDLANLLQKENGELKKERSDFKERVSVM